jgi:hypothetical protein
MYISGMVPHSDLEDWGSSRISLHCQWERSYVQYRDQLLSDSIEAR